jgi:hypothetical protein
MSEIHQLSETNETAEDFLRQMSAGPMSRPAGARAPVSRARAAEAEDLAPGFGSHAVPLRRGRVRPRPRTSEAPAGTGPAPWAAATASMLIWGGGQWLNGQRQLALLLLSLEGLALAMVYALGATWDAWLRLGWIFFVDASHLRTAAFGVGFLVPVLAVAGVLQAWGHAARFRADAVCHAPWPLAGLASAAVPGWGQLLNGEAGKAGLFLSAWGASAYVLGVAVARPAFWAEFDHSGRVFAGLPVSALLLAAASVAALAALVAAYDAALTARHRGARYAIG